MKKLFLIIVFALSMSQISFGRNIHVIKIVEPELKKVYENLENTLKKEIDKIATSLFIPQKQIFEYEMTDECCFYKGYLQNFVIGTMNVNKDDIVISFILAHGSHRSKEEKDAYPSIMLRHGYIHYNDLLNALLVKMPSHIFTIAYTCNQSRGAEGVMQKVHISADSLISISKVKNPAIYQQLFKVENNKTQVIHFFSSQKESTTDFDEDLSGLMAPFSAMNYFTYYGLLEESKWENILTYMAILYGSKAKTNCPLVELLKVEITKKEGEAEVSMKKEGLSAPLCE